MGTRYTDEEIYRKHADELVRFAVGLVGRNDAPDIVAEAFVRAMSGRTWPTVANHRAYLMRAVINQARNHHRDRQRRWAKELRTAAIESTYEPEYRPEVQTAVLRLSLRQRAVVVLTYWDDLSASAIADELGISQGSVKRHLARARSKLRRVLVA